MPEDRQISAEDDQQAAASDRLYKALSRASRAEYPLDPATLKTFDAIMACPVTSVADPEALSWEERAQRAASAIEQAVTRFPANRDRRMAEAVFGIGDLAGLKVGQRLDEIGSPPYFITPDIFYKARPAILGAVRDHLGRTERPERPRPGRSQSSDDQPTRFLIHDVTTFTVALANFHYCGVALLYVFSQAWSRGDLSLEFGPSQTLCKWGDELFYAYVRFLGRAHRLRVRGDSVTPRQLDDVGQTFSGFLNSGEVRKYFPESARRELSDLFQMTTASVGGMQHITAPDAIRLFAMRRVELAQALESFYRDTWLPWFYSSVVHADVPADHTSRSALELAVARSGRMLSLLQRYFPLNFPVESHARASSLKRLLLFYESEDATYERVPMSADSVAVRFERTRAILARDDIVWHSK